MAQEIIPDKQDVVSCLSKKTYYVDFYQREYVWSEKTVKTLLDDIFYSFELSYNEHKDEEMTQELIEKYNWYYLNVFITNKVDGKVYIVDGQQRLSTLTLIATKLYHMATNENQRDVLKECIFAKDMFKGNVFCIDNEKRKDVMQCILDDQPYPGPFRNKTEETLVERYKDICKYIDEKQMSDEELTAFIFYFLKRLVLVELSIEKDDTSMVFEVINDRGEALRPFEILKGKMIGMLSKTDTDLYSDKWDRALSRLSTSDEKDNFFIDYIKSRFIFKSNAKQEHDIMNLYHRYIFDYNDIAEALSFRRTDKKHVDHIKAFINEDLEYYSRLYAIMRTSRDFEFLNYDRDINSFSSQYQYIMSACRINDPQEKEKIPVISKESDRLWVLFILNGIYDSNQYQNVLYSLNDKLRGKDISEYRGIFDDLLLTSIKEKRNTTSTPSLLDYNVFVRKNYTNTNTRFLRYFFARVEDYICRNINVTMQNDVQYIATHTGNKTGYHIEHILSHNDTNRGYFASDEEFEDQRNQLGGLLLLKGLDNISAGNEEFADKLKTYSHGPVWGHTLSKDFYHANKAFDKFNQNFKSVTGMEFEPIDIFDKGALDYRSHLLFELVKIIWEVK